jgi:hypothetical protein
MNPKDLVLISRFLLPVCPVSAPAASIAMTHVAHEPVRIPYERPDQDHPPEGEDSGRLPGTLLSVGAVSGAMPNTTTALTTSTWEPAAKDHSPLDHFFLEPDPHTRVKVEQRPRPAQRPLLPRARRGC